MSTNADVPPAAGHFSSPGMLKGEYNKHSQAQGAVVDACSPLLARAGREVPLTPDNTLTIAEWGCSHGGNSIAPVLLILQQLQQRLQQLPANNRDHFRPLQVHVVHTDVGSNDWSELFESCERYAARAQAQCPELHVTYAGVGGSMYRRNHPSASVDIAFAFSTLHWQSRKAVVMRRSLFAFGGWEAPEERAALLAHAVSDFRSFLRLRAEEFRPGGLLCYGNISCHDEIGEVAPDDTRAVVYHKLLQEVTAGMVADGLLQERELGLMAPPVFFLDRPTQEQVLQELADSWEVLEFSMRMAVSPVTTAWREGQASAEQLAEAYVNFWKAVVVPCFEAGLRAAGRQAPETAALIDELFARLYKAAVAAPGPVHFPYAAVLLRRR